jgi:hypothetical protein
MSPTACFSQIKPFGETLDLKERHTISAVGKMCYIYGGYMRISEKHYANMHVYDSGMMFFSFSFSFFPSFLLSLSFLSIFLLSFSFLLLFPSFSLDSRGGH